MVAVEEGGDIIDGEVWEVDDRCLTRLDALEGVPFLYLCADLEIQGHEGVKGYLFNRPLSGLAPCGTCWPPK
jgi:gamma-glutamylcyclotransferase (GGCT)/AIG2-like uncharacterized protein YtfP